MPLANFLARDYNRLGFRYRAGHTKTQRIQQLLLTSIRVAQLPGQHLPAAIVQQLHHAQLFQSPQALFHCHIQRPPGLPQPTPRLQRQHRSQSMCLSVLRRAHKRMIFLSVNAGALPTAGYGAFGFHPNGYIAQSFTPNRSKILC